LLPRRLPTANGSDVLEHCEGCISVADDIAVHCSTEEDHVSKLRNLMETAIQWGLLFSSMKTAMKAEQVRFFGCLHDESIVHSDPAKVAPIESMNSPK